MRHEKYWMMANKYTNLLQTETETQMVSVDLISRLATDCEFAPPTHPNEIIHIIYFIHKVLPQNYISPPRRVKTVLKSRAILYILNTVAILMLPLSHHEN